MSARALVLDITRLVSALDSGPLTGVERVERAYLRENAARGGEFLLKTSLGYLLLPNGAAALVEGWLQGADLPPPRFPDTLRRHLKARHQAIGALRQIARARAPLFGGLGQMLRTAYPEGGEAWLVGQSHWGKRDLGEIARALTTHVLVHDTIPLDAPQFCRPEAVTRFRAGFESLLRHAHHIVANSEHSAQAVQTHALRLGLPAPRMTVAHLGVDRPPPLTPAPFDPRPVFVTLGTIEPRKNHALLLDIWERLPQPRPLLAIIGKRGWLNEPVFARLDARPEDVIELNDASDTEVSAWLSRAHALLMPSQAEGFGLPMAEAAALGLPIIAHDLAVYREFLGNYPVYVDNSDPYSWARAVSDLAAQPRQRRQPPRLPSWEDHFAKALGARA